MDMQEAMQEAARRLSEREAGAVDEAITALITAGVPLADVEMLVASGGGATVVRQRRGPPKEVDLRGVVEHWSEGLGKIPSPVELEYLVALLEGKVVPCRI